jgi:hypothetical protein
MQDNFELDWMDENIKEIPGGNGMYKLFCIMLMKKKMTYANMYVLTYALNQKKYKGRENILKEKIVKDLATLYFYNNKKLPNGFEVVTK